MSSNSSLLPFVFATVLICIGALIIWTIYGTSHELSQLDTLPSLDSAPAGAKSILEGQISASDHVMVLDGGFVAFVQEERTRAVAPTGKPSTALGKWRTRSKTTPPLPVVVGNRQIVVHDYDFPRHLIDWQHALHNTDGTIWTTANTRLRGLIKGKPVVAIGKLGQDSNGTTIFKADVMTAGTRQSYRDALASVRKFTGSWLLPALFIAAALGLAMTTWSMITGGRN